MNKILILLTLTTLLITGCMTNDKSHYVAENVEMTDKKEKYYPDKEILNEYLESAIKNREYEESIFIITCSVLYKDCSTLEMDLKQFNPKGKYTPVKYKEAKAEYITYTKPPEYAMPDYITEDFKMIVLKYGFFILEDYKELGTNESGYVLQPQGVNIENNYRLDINRNSVSMSANKGYFGLVAIDKGER